MTRIICDRFLSVSPFKQVLQLNPQPCGYTYWQQTVVQGYQQAQGCIWSTLIPSLPKIDLRQITPTSYSNACTSPGSIFQIWPQMPDLRSFKLLLCGIPNPAIASSLPLTTYCTCRSPFLAGTAVLKDKIFKNKQTERIALYIFTLADLSRFTNI